jgi:tight adherence protein C
LIFGLVQAARRPNLVSQRMQAFITDREKGPPIKDVPRRLLPRELRGSFFNRTIGPFFQKIITFLGKSTPANTIAKLDYDLRLAGNPNGLHAREFYGVRALLIFLGIGLVVFTYLRSGSTNLTLRMSSLSFMLLSILLPKMWLNARIRQRKEELTHNLPDALDMLSVCATAGLSFDQGLRKICDYWDTPLIEEFKQMLQEMEMGVSRIEALRNLRNRVNVDDLSNFIAIIIQAENIGMSYAAVLQSQSKQQRILRQYRAKEKANSLPGKMVIPIAIFIFPAILAVILAPIIPIFINFLQGF